MSSNTEEEMTADEAIEAMYSLYFTHRHFGTDRVAGVIKRQQAEIAELRNSLEEQASGEPDITRFI